MTTISEAELSRIVGGIIEDRASIIKHNPLGPDNEILLWMLLAILTSYLNLTEIETPCFNGRPDARTYRDAINFILQNHRSDDFDEGKYLDTLEAC